LKFSSELATRSSTNADNQVCLRDGSGGKQFGKIVKFFAFKKRKYAIIRKFTISGDSIFGGVDLPSLMSLQRLLQEHLYGHQFIGILESDLITVVNVEQFLSKFLVIPTISGKLFAVQLFRHFKHD